MFAAELASGLIELQDFNYSMNFKVDNLWLAHPGLQISMGGPNPIALRHLEYVGLPHGLQVG